MVCHNRPRFYDLPNQSMKSWRSVNHLAPCILVISLVSVAIAEADQNFAGFRHIDAAGEPPGTAQAALDWGPVQTDKASVANLSPVLLPFFNNGPVFGLPGTVVGDFWQNTQLTGDWGGFRTSLAEIAADIGTALRALANAKIHSNAAHPSISTVS